MVGGEGWDKRELIWYVFCDLKNCDLVELMKEFVKIKKVFWYVLSKIELLNLDKWVLFK